MHLFSAVLDSIFFCFESRHTLWNVPCFANKCYVPCTRGRLVFQPLAAKTAEPAFDSPLLAILQRVAEVALRFACSLCLSAGAERRHLIWCGTSSGIFGRDGSHLEPRRPLPPPHDKRSWWNWYRPTRSKGLSMQTASFYFTCIWQFCNLCSALCLSVCVCLSKCVCVCVLWT